MGIVWLLRKKQLQSISWWAVWKEWERRAELQFQGQLEQQDPPLPWPQRIRATFIQPYCVPIRASSVAPACQCRRCGFNLWVGKILWRRKWQHTPVFFPGKCPGQRSLAGYRDCKRVRHDLETKQHCVLSVFRSTCGLHNVWCYYSPHFTDKDSESWNWSP